MQVFVATKGGENVKLGGVEVRAIPFRDAKRAVDDAIEAKQTARRQIEKEQASQADEYARKEAVVKQAEARQKQAESSANQAIQDFAKQVHSAVKSARDQIEAAKKTIDAIENAGEHDRQMFVLWDFEKKMQLNDLEWTLDGMMPQWFESERDESYLTPPNEAAKIVSDHGWDRFFSSRAAVLKASTQLKSAIPPVRAATLEVERLRDTLSPTIESTRVSTRSQFESDPERFFESLPVSSQVAKTDADGRCRLRLPRSERWVLAAHSSRAVGSDEERYVWIVALPSDVETFSLSNDNLISPYGQPHLFD